MQIPASVARATTDLFGELGAAWLERLPAHIAAYERRWAIRVLAPFPNLSYNYVAPAVRADGTQLVFKTWVANPELLTEIAAMRHYDGRGIARLIDSDPEGGAMLLERLLPGTPLSELEDDDAATLIAAEVMRKLWRPLPPDHPFPTTAKWAGGLDRLRAAFGGGTGPFPRPLVERAEGLFRELLASAGEPMLLHGDLHHDNILAAEREPWLALDPKGLAGEPAYEVGALLRNPGRRIRATPDLRALTARRAAILSEALEIDRARILGWGLAQAMLSAWWDYEDHGRVDAQMLALAEAIDRELSGPVSFSPAAGSSL